MAISESKRARFTGRGKGPPFLKLLHHVIDSEEFALLDGSALKLLIDLARLYNGKNNGDLCPALLRRRWKSEQKLTRATRLLEDSGWIVKTKQGGMGIGPNLFAITWWPIDACGGRHEEPAETVASNRWNKKTPHPNRVLVAPESGVRSRQNGHKTTAIAPESGAKNGVLKAA